MNTEACLRFGTKGKLCLHAYLQVSIESEQRRNDAMCSASNRAFSKPRQLTQYIVAGELGAMDLQLATDDPRPSVIATTEPTERSNVLKQIVGTGIAELDGPRDGPWVDLMALRVVAALLSQVDATDHYLAETVRGLHTVFEQRVALQKTGFCSGNSTKAAAPRRKRKLPRSVGTHRNAAQPAADSHTKRNAVDRHHQGLKLYDRQWTGSSPHKSLCVMYEELIGDAGESERVDIGPAALIELQDDCLETVMEMRN